MAGKCSTFFLWVQSASVAREEPLIFEGFDREMYIAELRANRKARQMISDLTAEGSAGLVK